MQKKEKKTYKMNTHNEEELEIDLKELWYAIRHRILLILAAGLLVGCIFCAYTKFFVDPSYTSTSRMLVLTKETTLSSRAELQMGSQLTKDYRELILSPPVLEETVTDPVSYTHLDVYKRQQILLWKGKLHCLAKWDFI